MNMIGKYVIIRADRAGVFAGVLAEKNGDAVVLTDCRLLWQWDGGASISQLALSGPSKPQNCKFTVTLDKICILGVIEVIPCTELAERVIKEVAVWQR